MAAALGFVCADPAAESVVNVDHTIRASVHFHG